MRFDPEIARDILLRVEAEQTSPGWTWSIGPDDFVQYYMARKLREAGLLLGDDIPSQDTNEPDYIEIQELTFAGHEFLNTIRDPAAWKAIGKAAATIGNASVAVLVDLGKAYVQTELRKRGLL